MQGWEDRACPLALPQREAAEDHENCPTRHLAAQFPLCPMATVEPISGDTPGLGSPASSPYLSAGKRRRKSTCSWLGPHKPFPSFLSRGSSPSCLELRKHTFVHSSISLHTSHATSPIPYLPHPRGGHDPALSHHPEEVHSVWGSYSVPPGP